MNVLHICADPKPTEESVSKQMATTFFTKLIEQDPELEITNNDLYENPPPYLDYDAYRGLWFPVLIEGYQATDADLAAFTYAREQAEAFNQADILVLTCPMWNYSVPGILKSWIDQVLNPGLVFDMYKGKPRPTHKVKHLVLLVSSGETFKEGDPHDALSPLVETAFGKIGIENIHIAWADGQDPLTHIDCEPRKRLALEAVEEIAEDIFG